jgi:hypothetical protein
LGDIHKSVGAIKYPMRLIFALLLCTSFNSYPLLPQPVGYTFISRH